MDLRHLFLILSTILLVECNSDESVTAEIVVNPIQETNNAPTFKESNHNVINLKKSFYPAVIEKLTALSDEPIKMAIRLVKNIYADMPENENVNHFLALVLDDNQNSKNPERPILKIELFLRLNLVFDFISGPIDESWEKRDIELKEQLAKYDVQSVAIKFQKTYDKYLEWLITEIDAYSNKMQSDGQLQRNEFKKICQQYKDENNIENRWYILGNIVTKLNG